MIGETVGSHRVTHKLGEGGWGVVYAAEHPLIGQKVAIKLLHENMSRDADVVNRFFNEARSAAAIKHPGIIGIFDFGHHSNGSAYIVMELLGGESLAARLEREGRMAEETAVRLVRQAASALAAAHEAGIVHRDLKPDNLFLVPDEEVTGGERVKVLDFGIAKLVTDKQQQGTVKTRTGSVLGSPAYMAPEQCRGTGHIDHRADVYSLGCVLYEMLCGRPPFLGDGVGEVIAKHIYEHPEPPRELVADLSPAVERVVLQAMAKRPEARFGSMAEMSAALDKLSGVSGNKLAARTPRENPRATPREGDAFGPTAEHKGTPPMSTTLGEVAAEVSLEMPAARKRRGRLVSLAVAAVAAGSAIIGVLVFGRGCYRTTRATVVAADPGSAGNSTGAESGPAPTPQPIPIPIPPQPAQPETRLPEPEPPATVQLLIESVPPAASIYRAADGVKLGVTPARIPVLRGDGEMEFLLKKSGFRDARASLSTAADGQTQVRLKPAPKKERDELDPYAK